MITEEYFLSILNKAIAGIHGQDFADVFMDCAYAYAIHPDNPYEFLKCCRAGKVTAEEIGIYMDIYDIFAKSGGRRLQIDKQEKANSLINKLVAIKKTRA